MFTNISKLGTPLTKSEQQLVKGAFFLARCRTDRDCDSLSSQPPFEYEKFFCFRGYCQIH